MPTAISQTWFKAGIAILTVSYVTTVPLYFLLRHKFPIAHRLPGLVICELTMALGLGVGSLLVGAFPDRTADISNCKVYNLLASVLEHAPVLMIAFRVTWLFLKDFNTKLLIKLKASFIRSSEHLHPTSPASPNISILQELTACIVKNLLGRFNIFQSALIIMAIPVLVAVVDIFFAASAPYDTQLGILDIRCYDMMKLSINLKLGILCLLWLQFSLGIRDILRMQDRMGFSLEIKFLAIPMTSLSLLLISLVDRDFVQNVLNPTRLWLFVDGAVFVPSIFIIQALFPVYLAFKNSQRENAYDKKSPNPLLERLTSSKNCQSPREELRKLIRDPIGKEKFLNFLEGEFAVENLMFYEGTLIFSALYASSKESDRVEAQHFSKFLFEMFILPNSPSAVNISGEMQTQIIKAFHSDPVPGQVFDEVREEILKLMTRDCFRRFQLTKDYYELLEMPSSPSNMSRASLESSNRSSIHTSLHLYTLKVNESL